MEKCYWPAGEYGSWGYNQGEAAAAGPPWASPYGAVVDRTASASRSHSEAEKRRRDRINAQLATLRKLIPQSEKMDKAALLGHVVEQVREQSKIAKEVSTSSVPTETDEVTIDHFNDDVQTSPLDNQNLYFRASICCDDRPELFADINRAVKGLGLTIHQADITSIGGRLKSNLVLSTNNTSNDDDDGDEKNTCPDSIKRGLKLALSRMVISAGSSSYSAMSKRQRFFYPNYH